MRGDLGVSRRLGIIVGLSHNFPRGGLDFMAIVYEIMSRLERRLGSASDPSAADRIRLIRLAIQINKKLE